MSKKTFVIIDGNAIIHRAYHALPPLTAQDGTMVNAVYGFTSMLLKVLNDLKPDYLTVAFDVAGGTFRDKIYKEYKAKRVKADQELYDQIPLVHQVVEAFDIPIYTKEGYEADDVIGTVVKRMEKNKDVTSIIVTGDMDLLQLVNDHDTEVYLLRKGMSDFHLYDEEAVKERFGFGPKMVVDYKSLKGDSSDNIPGIKGIGDKTAKELIEKFGSIDDLYKTLKKKRESVEEQTKPGVFKKICEGEKDAMMSKDLATIRQDIKGIKFDFNDTAVQELDRNKLTELFRRFAFYSLLKRIPGGPLPEFSEKNTSKNKSKKKPGKGKMKFSTVRTTKELGSLLKKLSKEDVFACKEIITGKDILTSELIGFVIYFDTHAYFIEMKDYGDKDKKRLFKIFADQSKILVGHDLKGLAKILLKMGEKVEVELFDIMIASYLINSSTRAHDLRSVILRELGKELPAGADQSTLFGTDPEVVANELHLIMKARDKYVKQLEDWEDLGLFSKVEMPLTTILAQMELNGVAVDEKMLEKLSVDVARAIEKVSKKIWKSAGQEFNIASSVQLREILFEKMDLPTEGIKKGKTGFSTAAPELEKLRAAHPIIEMIEEHRELAKLQNTYVDVLPRLVNKKTGRIHTTFNQAVTTTGRLSSSEPNLQNIPIRTDLGKEIRKAFVAEKGNILVAADYSQIELRIVASLAEDEKLIEIFEQGKDVHKATAAAINNVALSEVTKKMRYSAKEVNFGVLYGMGSYGLSWRAGIPLWQAKEFIKKYFENFSGVKKYIDRTLKYAKKDGCVETLFGRRRYVPELKSPNFQVRNSGERMAINMPIQGTAADLMKMAMIKVDEELTKKFSNKKAKMILQVHDEIIVEVERGLENRASKIVKDAMENVVNLRVPVEVEVNTGKSWGKMK